MKELGEESAGEHNVETESELHPSRSSSVSCVQSVWDEGGSKTCTWSRCEVEPYIVNVEQAKMPPVHG